MILAHQKNTANLQYNQNIHDFIFPMPEDMQAFCLERCLPGQESSSVFSRPNELYSLHFYEVYFQTVVDLSLYC